MGKREYSYLKVENFYLNLHKNMISLMWYLLWRTKPFDFHRRAHNKYLKYLPRTIIKFIRILNLMRKFMVNKKKHHIEIISSHYNGHILVMTRTGYKIFNLRKKIVASQYSNQIKTSHFTNITNYLHTINKTGASPTIFKVDISNKCIYERYINLYKAKRFYPFNAYFYKLIFPIWQKNIELFPKRFVNGSEYILQLNFHIMDMLGKYNTEMFDNTYSKDIIAFVHEITNDLLKDPGKILLSISHGDVYYRNILLNSKHAILIDWDTIKERSIFHDVFYMCFQNLLGRRDINYMEFLDEFEGVLDRAVISVQNLMVKDELKKSKDFYRYLFYLEYIHLDIENQIILCTNSKDFLFHTKYLFCSYVQRFKEIEYNLKVEKLHYNQVVNEVMIVKSKTRIEPKV